MKVFKSIFSLLCVTVLMVSFAMPTMAAKKSVSAVAPISNFHFVYSQNSSKYVKGYIAWRALQKCKGYQYKCNGKTKTVKYNKKQIQYYSKELSFKKKAKPYNVKMYVRVKKTSGKYGSWMSYTLVVRK